MIAAGIDIGSTTTKAVLLEDGRILAASLRPSGVKPALAAREAFAAALAEAGKSERDVARIATTGYGRRLAGMGDLVLTEIKACAVGALASGAEGGPPRTLIDVGGQDTKVIALNAGGAIEDFSMNDKCAAGTGRFLEMLAGKLGLSYEAFAAAAGTSTTSLQLNATCAVFAESEVVGLLARDVSLADIAAAAHAAIASRIAAQVRRVGARPPAFFAGGGACNEALVRAVARALDQPVAVLPRPQFVVALGAAIGAAGKAGE